MLRLALIGIFGLLGIYSRYFLNYLTVYRIGQPFHYATLSINALGSLLIGVVFVLGSEKLFISENLKVALMVGLLGGFTTFSAFSLDTIHLMQFGKHAQAFLYALCSVIGSIACCYFGIWLTRKLVM